MYIARSGCVFTDLVQIWKTGYTRSPPAICITVHNLLISVFLKPSKLRKLQDYIKRELPQL